jgi:hypothetical protein
MDKPLPQEKNHGLLLVSVALAQFTKRSGPHRFSDPHLS